MKLRILAAGAGALAAGLLSVSPASAAEAEDGPYCQFDEVVDYSYTEAGSTLAFEVTCDGNPWGYSEVTAYTATVAHDAATGEEVREEAEQHATIDNGDSAVFKVHAETGVADGSVCIATYRVFEWAMPRPPHWLSDVYFNSGDC
ncbi:hypothetical protein [Salininema proteolyticum]|uniref:Secreted protein n=1 Tax=Salininema proteolyticum TaxID=1607685 RepID=A0ABV8U356_9ACTN